MVSMRKRRGRQEAKAGEDVYSGTHKQNTETRLVLGGFAILLVVGGILAWLLLGPGPATIVVGVIVVGGSLLLAIYKGLDLLEAWLKRG